MLQKVKPSRNGAAGYFAGLDRQYEDGLDAQDAHDALTVQHAKRISAEFVAALPLGEEARFEATRVGDALYDLACSSYQQLLTDIVIAAAGSNDPVLRALIQQLGAGYADIVLTGGAQ